MYYVWWIWAKSISTSPLKKPARKTRVQVTENYFYGLKTGGAEQNPQTGLLKQNIPIIFFLSVFFPSPIHAYSSPINRLDPSSCIYRAAAPRTCCCPRAHAASCPHPRLRLPAPAPPASAPPAAGCPRPRRLLPARQRRRLPAPTPAPPSASTAGCSAPRPRRLLLARLRYRLPAPVPGLLPARQRPLTRAQVSAAPLARA